MFEAEICTARTRLSRDNYKGKTKRGRGLLKVITMNVVETQAGENEGMQQDEDKILATERQSLQLMV